MVVFQKDNRIGIGGVDVKGLEGAFSKFRLKRRKTKMAFAI